MITFPRDINNNATTVDEAKPAVNGAMSTIDPIIFAKNPDQKLDNDMEIKYQQFAQSVDTFYKKYYCQKTSRANDHTVLHTKNKSHPENCTSKFIGPTPPPVNPFCNQPMTHGNLMQFEELSFSNFIPYNPTRDDDSTNSDLDYIQQEGNVSILNLILQCIFLTNMMASTSITSTNIIPYLTMVIV